MYLKRLDIHGFKSFGLTTVFEFGTGVTCIAGPNGAGKTNVAEAVRWVLGEHASRVIRARKTEDIIFAGSAKRPQLGMAEVKLTLDNSDGWLPLDFEEVVISRRAYRNGENEYYVNQSRVRLRDVTDLFLKAQVGQNSYAFMGQGLVEQVLTLRPEERRGMIEEAADVRLHRDKLEEARNRLRGTRDNLDRVQMLVSEIAPRIRQLERQADRATSYARLSAELAETLQALYGQQWMDAQDAIAVARAAFDQRQKEFDAARQEFQAVEEAHGALAGAADERRRDIAEREASYRALEDYRRDLERRIATDDERREMLLARQAELTAEIAALQAEQEQLAAMVAQHDERARAQANELADARRPDAGSEELALFDRRLAEERNNLAETERLAGRAGTRLAEAEGRSAALAEQYERLQAELSALEQARHEQVTLLRAWARELASRRQRVNELAPAVQRETRALNEKEAQVQDATARIALREQEIRSLTSEISSAEARLDAAQSTEIELPPPDAGVRAVLVAGGKVTGEESDPDTQIRGLIGMLGQLLRVPAGLERAMEAALADSLHAIVVETQEDALAAIELLVSEDAGRAMVIPLSDVKVTSPVNILEERGILGVASELVRCDSRFRPLVNTLLGRTIVVQNLGVGKAVLRRGLGNVVTLDGILLRTHGAMTAGSAKAIRIAFVHQREIGELPQDLERMRAARKAASEDLEGARQTLAAAEETLAERAPQLERLRNELTQAEAVLRQHRARLPTAAAQLAALHARRRDAEVTLSGSAQGLQEARDGLERERTDAHEYERRRNELRHDVEQLIGERETLAASSSQRSARIATLEEQRDAMQQQRETYATTLARLEEERGRRDSAIARMYEDIDAANTRLEATRRELEEKNAAIALAVEELTPARAALEQIETRRRTINDEIGAARTRSIEAERALLDAQATVSLREQEVEALKERFAEEGYHPSPDGHVQKVQLEEERPPAWMAATLSSEHGDDDLPPVRGGADINVAEMKERASQLREEIRRLGPINEQAAADFAENRERYEFLSTQLSDLTDAEASLQEAIRELESIIKERFSATFQHVNREFSRYFETFFGGGNAELLLTEPDENGLPGVDIVAQPPRKRVRALNMLSGGERSLTALALLFALLQTNPSPICVLDEVDAALDEANVDRFTAALRELAERTQFIIITHNRRTLEMADTIYGVSMGDDGVSSVLSLKLDDLPAA